eukprot:4135952-Amphidinium_carterae.1
MVWPRFGHSAVRLGQFDPLLLSGPMHPCSQSDPVKRPKHTVANCFTVLVVVLVCVAVSVLRDDYY